MALKPLNPTLIPPNATIVVGLSGGPDSVYLLHQLLKLQQEKHLKLVIAHLDHEWRADSSKDEEFCRNLADQLKLPYVSQKVSTLGKQFKFSGSKEEFGRHARRYFLEQVKKDHDADFIALAHHKQDQQENFFIRLLRGASLSGLVGMKAQEGPYLRPLLHVDKEDILDYLDSHKIPYILDPSNESPEFLRNRVRKEVIPALQKVDPRFDKNFDATLERLKEANQFIKEQTEHVFKQITHTQDNRAQLNVKQLLKVHPYLQQRLILHWLIAEQVPFTPTYQFLQEILRFLKQPGSKEHQIHHDWKIVKKKGIASIGKLSSRSNGSTSSPRTVY